ncbi:MAG: hypothetical protein E4G90_11730 [Gemmatimonadales bacterium]|nr:MAG: hypothetical protein E4G90_11730 [Gemmatimonadales bacterium]
MDMQSDGKILIGAFGRIRRYTATGARDVSFGVDGLLDLGTTIIVSGITVLADNDIMVLGERSGDALLMRLTPGGALDGTFAGGGSRSYDFGLLRHRFQGVTEDPAGNLIVVGRHTTIAGWLNFLVARMSPAGILDPTFGTGGYLLEHRVDDARAVALDGQGRIVVGGQEVRSESGIHLTRHIPN